MYLLHLQDVPEYNKLHGWAKGNQLIKEFAAELQSSFADSLVFRAYGNDFAIVSQGHRTIDNREINSLAGIGDTVIRVEIHHIDLSTTREYTLDKMEKMEILPADADESMIDDAQRKN